MNEESLQKLAHAKYWDDRYAAEEGNNDFDWFRSFSLLEGFLSRHLTLSSPLPRILHLGCGNSTLSADLYEGGHHDQTNIDFSSIIITLMSARYPAMDWQVMDVRKMTFPDCSFDVEIDKSTLDAMFHGSPWDPPDDVRANIGAYVHEVHRTLKPGGKWLYVTYRQPHFIRPLLERPALWTMEVEPLNGPADQGGVLEYFGYVMSKAIP